jgi:hypothetical protein
MKITKTSTRNGLIVLHLEDERGPHEIELTSIGVEHLIGALRASQEEAIGHPSARSYGQPGIHRVQYIQNPETVYFRIFVSDRIYHEYPIDRDTSLAEELMRFADRAEARNLAKTTHQPPDSPSGKN